MDALNELKFIIHRNFCSVRDIGDVRGARESEQGSGRGARARVGMSPERLKVYLEEYSGELSVSPIEADCEIESRGGSAELLRFIATLPLKGESADAVRGMAKALSKLDMDVSPVPGSFCVDGNGARLTLTVRGEIHESDALQKLRDAFTPLGFCASAADARDKELLPCH